MRRRLPLARHDDADVGDGQGGVRLALGRPPVGDVDALGGIAANVGRAAGGRGLDEVAALLQSLLPLKQHAEGRRGGGRRRLSAQSSTGSQCDHREELIKTMCGRDDLTGPLGWSSKDFIVTSGVCPRVLVAERKELMKPNVCSGPHDLQRFRFRCSTSMFIPNHCMSLSYQRPGL